MVLRLTLIALLVTARFAFGDGPISNVALQLDSYRAGASAAHRVTFEIRAGDPEIHRAELAYPDGFRFNGFQTLGPLNTPVGACELDLDFDGVAERALPLLALSADSAYIDLLADGRFSPATDPLLRHAGATGFDLRLPFGGDANPHTRVAPFGARVTLTLFPGLIVNPALGGRYPVAAVLVTVDPDTDGPSDDLGAAPVTSRSGSSMSQRVSTTRWH